MLPKPLTQGPHISPRDGVEDWASLGHKAQNLRSIQLVSTIGALIITYTILKPYYRASRYSIMGPKNLF